MFEWMMTDACGLKNTGWSNTGAVMQQYYEPEITAWTPSYDINVADKFGSATTYPSGVSAFSISTYMNQFLDMSKSLTLFAYFRVVTSGNRYAYLEFYQTSSFNSSSAPGPGFWFNASTLSWNFSKSNSNSF